MPVPSIPPEVLEAILVELPPQDAETIPTLLSCTLVSQDFAAVARSDLIWKPIVEHQWSGRAPLFVELSDEQDRQDLSEAFPEGDKTSLTLYGRLIKRPTIKRILDRHLEALLAEPTHKIPHVLAIVELGETNTFPRLDPLAFATSDEVNEEDWLARRYWARQARGAISRRKAIDVWKRIGEGWNDLEAFFKGVYAFSAFYGDQKNVTYADGSFGPRLRSIREIMAVHFKDDDLMLQMTAQMFIIEKILLEQFRLDPQARDPITPRPLKEHFIYSVLRESVKLAESATDQLLRCHPTTIAAFLAEMLHTQSRPLILASPVQLLAGPMLALAWADEDGRPIDPSNAIYLSFNPPQLLASSTIKEMCAGMRTMHQAFRHAPSVSFDEPTSAADLIRVFAADIGRALQAQQEARHFADAETEDAMSVQYACSLVKILVKISRSGFWIPEPSVDVSRELSGVALALIRYPWDADYLVKHIFSGRDPRTLPFMVHEQLSLARAKDRERRMHHRSSLDSQQSQPRFEVGDVVELHEAAGVEVNVIVGWETKDRLPFHAGADPAALLAEVRSSDEMNPGNPLPAYDLLNLQGEPKTLMDSPQLHLHHATSEELHSFCHIHDIGKYFKRVDSSGPSPRFVIAEDLKKLYPDD